MDKQENEPQNESSKSTREVVLRLKPGQVVRIQSVSPEAESDLLILADEHDGQLKTSRSPEHFPVDVVLGESQSNQQAKTAGTNPLSWEFSAEWLQPMRLFWISLGIYTLVRLIGLAEWPIFFFSDEAMPVIRAQDFLANGFRSRDEVPFPTFFKNTFQYSLSTTVYLQTIGYAFFGKSVFVARAVAVASTIPAAAVMGLLLKQVYNLKYWWVGTLLFSIVPAWFLHSRTAFETVTATSFFAVFAYFYFRYRQTAEGKQLYLALLFGALCFYTYNPARLVIVVAGLLLLLSDAKFHWENRQTSLKGLGVLVLLVLPYLRHQWLYPQSVSEHLYGLGAYWVRDISTAEKIRQYFEFYLWGLSPFYWYQPEQHEWVRHHMLNYGHLSRLTIPFAIWGLVIILRNWREPKYRNVLLLLLAAPAGSALVEIYITRALFFVVPASIITAIGLLDLLSRLWQSGWLKDRLTHAQFVLAIFVVMAFLNVRIMFDGNNNGPTWYDLYGLGGLQFGASQVFDKAADILDETPGRQMYVSNSWTNGADTVARFFFEEPLPFRLVDINRDNLKTEYPMTENTVFIVTRQEFEQINASGKFTNIVVEDVIPFPDGSEGFFVVDADYVSNIQEIFANELVERQRPVVADVFIEDRLAQVTYPRMDIGDIHQLFDNDILTLARTDEGNPATFEIQFNEPMPSIGLRFNFGDRAADISAMLVSADGETHQNSGSFKGAAGDSTGEILFDQPYDIQTLTLVVNDPDQGAAGHVHLWEIDFIPPDG